MADAEDIAAIEHDREQHHDLARRYQADADRAAAQGDDLLAASCAQEARHLEALVSEDDHKLEAFKIRRRAALSQATANRQAIAPDFTR
jgi:hypothetical protein